MSRPYFSWKGKTFNNITTTIQQTVNTGSNIFKASPLHIYRKELTLNPIVYSRRVSIDELDQSIASRACTLIVDDFEKKPDRPISCFISDATNARKRVRSAGMVQSKDVAKANNYYTSSSQYMSSRSKTFNLHTVSSAATGETDCAVCYNTNNDQFAQQGAVSSSSLVTRIKYNTITNNGCIYHTANGVEIANALAYGVPASGNASKHILGYPTHNGCCLQETHLIP